MQVTSLVQSHLRGVSPAVCVSAAVGLRAMGAPQFVDPRHTSCAVTGSYPQLTTASASAFHLLPMRQHLML